MVELNPSHRKLVLTVLAMAAVIGSAVLLSIAAGRGRNPTAPVSTASAAAEQAAGKEAGPLWAKACAKNQDGVDTCYVEQFVIAQPQNLVLLHVRIGYIGPQGMPRLIMAAPPGVWLPGGLTLTLDKNKPIALPFNSCDAGSCLAAVEMDQDALKQFTAGTVLMAHYVLANNSPVDVPVRMAGLSDALKTVSAK